MNNNLVNHKHFKVFCCIIWCILFYNISSAQIVNLPCETEVDAFLGLDRKDWNGGNTDFHSEGSMHNFDLPTNTFGDCKFISNIDIEFTIINIDVSNLPPDCPIPGDYYINITGGCPSLAPASCNVANIIYEAPNNPLNSQVLSFTSPPENFPFGDVIGVDIVPVMDVNCTNGQSALSSGGIVLDYQICVTVTVSDETIDTPADLGSDQSICSTDMITLDPGSYAFYDWDPNGETSPTIDVGPGNYTVTVTDINGCTDTDEISIFQFPDSGITFDPLNPAVCDNGQVNVSVNESYGSYVWSNGAMGQSVNLPAGSYDVTITDSNNCTAVNSITVDNIDPPNAGIDNFIEVCNDGTAYDIDALLTVHDAGGIWTDDNSSGVDINANPFAVDFFNIAPGSYQFTYTVSGILPCTPDQATITVDVYDQNNAGVSDTEQYCPDPGILDFILLLSNPDGGGTWSDLDLAGVDLSNPFAVNFDGILPGTYNFEYILSANGGCPQQSAILTIVILESAIAGENNNATVCEGSQFDLQTLVMGANGSGTFEDTDGSGALSGSIVNTTGLAGQSFNFTFLVGAVGSPCGQDEAIFTLSIESSLSPGEEVNDSACIGGNIDLTDFLINADPGGFFNDVNSAGGLTGNILNTSGLTPGMYVYQYVVGDGVTCPINDVEMVITLLEEPSITFSAPQVFVCEEECEDIQINLVGTSPFSFPLELYSGTTGNLLLTENIVSNIDSFILTTCNMGNDIIINNDTLSLLSDSLWIIKIPTLSDANCFVNNLESTDSLIINTISNSTYQLDTSACITDTLIINGVMFFDGNSTYSDTLSGMICDSIVNINVNFSDSDTIRQEPILCSGDSIFIDGLWFSESIPYAEFLVVNPNGCDSILIVDVSFYPLADTLLDLEFCSGDSIVINNTVYDDANPSGTEILMGESANGCDSIINVSIQFTDDIIQLINNTLCPSEFIELGGEIFNEGNPTGQILIAGSGCDTIINVDLSFHLPSDSTIAGMFCPDYSIIVNGTMYDNSNPTGAETLPSASIFGCDSLVNIDLNFYSPSIENYTIDICDNESINLNGTIYDASNTVGSEIITAGSINGCDSVVNIQLNILQTYNNAEEFSICEGDSIFLEGEWQFSSGMYIDSLQSIDLCDSIIQTNLTVIPCQVNVDITKTDNNCAGDQTGVITLDILTDITTPYAVNWLGLNFGSSGSLSITTSQNIINITDLISDNYEISILDSSGSLIYQETIEVFDLSTALSGSWIITDTIYCADSLGSIEFVTNGGTLPYSYAWDPSSIGNTQLAQDIEAGEYSLTVTDINGCFIDTSFALINSEPISTMITLTDPSCENSNDGQISIFDISGGTAPYVIYINEELLDSTSAIGLDSGTYIIEIIDANNCIASYDEELINELNSDLVTYTEDYSIQQGDSIMLEGIALDSNLTFLWLDSSYISCLNCLEPVVSPDVNTSYTLVVTNPSGCSQTIVVNVEVEIISIEDVFPNIFSPNNDNINDELVFISQNIETIGMQLYIYDRWGNSIFQNVSAGNEVSWDGTKNGSILNGGVYVYTLIIQDLNGNSELVHGDVLLIR